VAVVDDYAHHPTEVGAAIDAARQRYPGRRLIAIHTPHTYSRVSRLLEDYRQSFAAADVVIIGPIEEARERGMPKIVSSEDVAERAGPTRDVHVAGSSDEAIILVTRIVRPGDVLLVLSLGGFDKLAPRLLDALEVQGVRR
jgi:UDP-N-acetylmuramate--alanine ligase